MCDKNVALEGFRKKKKKRTKYGLIPDKKSLIPDTFKISWWNKTFFYMFFFARNTLREVSKKKKKNM